MLATAGTFSTYFNIKKQRQLFESFILKIDHEKIVRERLNTPVLIIYHKDITKIIKQANGGFLIQGKSKLDSIRIPAQMEDYQQLEIALNQLKEVAVLICSILFTSIYF